MNPNVILPLPVSAKITSVAFMWFFVSASPPLPQSPMLKNRRDDICKTRRFFFSPSALASLNIECEGERGERPASIMPSMVPTLFLKTPDPKQLATTCKFQVRSQREAAVVLDSTAYRSRRVAVLASRVMPLACQSTGRQHPTRL